MGSKPQPTVVLIHGAWHSSNHFLSLKRLLEQEGSHCIAIDLPSVGGNPPTPDGLADVQIIREALSSIIDEGNHCIVVAHSYGGIPASSALEGLGMRQRMERGLAGGVVAMVYLCAWMLPKGMSLMSLRGEYPSSWKIQGDTMIPENPQQMFFNDLPPDEATRLVAILRPQSLSAMHTPVSYETCHDIPTYYLICENDNAITLTSQEAIVANFADKIITERCAAGHSPWLSMPKVVLQLIKRAISENP